MPMNPVRLKSALLNTGLQTKDNPLYQVILNLIDNLATLLATVTSGSGGGGTIINNITNNNSITQQMISEMVDIGDTVVFGPSSSSVSSPSIDRSWSVLTNGDPINPELIFAGGDVIMTHIP